MRPLTSQVNRASNKAAALTKTLALPAVYPAPPIKTEGDGDEELVGDPVVLATTVKLAHVRHVALLL